MGCRFLSRRFPMRRCTRPPTDMLLKERGDIVKYRRRPRVEMPGRGFAELSGQYIYRDDEYRRSQSPLKSLYSFSGHTASAHAEARLGALPGHWLCRCCNAAQKGARRHGPLTRPKRLSLSGTARIAVGYFSMSTPSRPRRPEVTERECFPDSRAISHAFKF